jgi:tetratricopeptide (TPR) repeat protein
MPKDDGKGDLPAHRAAFFYDRAKDLSLTGACSSLEQERMLRDLQKAISFYADQISHYMFLGKLFRQSLDIASAIFCYRFVLNLQPSNLQVRKQLGELLVVRGQELMVTAAKVESTLKFQAARACFDEALEVNKDDTKAWTLKAVCHIHAKELTEAHEAITRAMKTPQPTTAEMYILRAKIFWGRGLIEQGNVDIRVAAMMDAEHPEVVSFFTRSFVKAEKLYKESVKYFTNGKYKEALFSVNHAMHITTDDVKLLILQSKIYRMLGELQSSYDSMLKAKAIFEKAFEGTDYPMELPPDISLQINLILNDMSIDFASKGNYQKAILLLNKIIKSEQAICKNGLVKPNHKFFVNRGDCHRALNALRDAVRDYDEALSIKPDDWDIRTRLSLTHYLIGTNFFNESQFYESRGELDKAIKYNPKVSEYYAVRGKTHYFTSQFQLAYADFIKALQLNDKNEEVREWLSQFDDEERSPSKDHHQQQKQQKQRSSSLKGGVVGGQGQGSNAAIVQSSSEKKKKVDFTKVSHLKEVETVLHVHVSSEDVVQMMLQPQLAAKLPALRLLGKKDLTNKPVGAPSRKAPQPMKKQNKFKTSAEQMNTLNMTSSSFHETGSSAELPNIPVKESPFLFDYSKLQSSYAAHEIVRQKTAKVQGIFDTTHQEVAKGPLWGMVETAKALAYAKSHPNRQHLSKTS